MRPFAPRPIRFREILAHEGWRLKRYAISAGGAAGVARADVAIPDLLEFADGRALALAALPAHASESFCVWDLQVIGFERDAYVASVLAPDAGPGAVDVYLARRLEVNAATTSLPPNAPDAAARAG